MTPTSSKHHQHHHHAHITSSALHQHFRRILQSSHGTGGRCLQHGCGTQVGQIINTSTWNLRLNVYPRTSVDNALDSISKELRESSVYPILLNPLSVKGRKYFDGDSNEIHFQITKLHCGSIITFFDISSSDGATVALDVCLTAFIIAKVGIGIKPFYVLYSFIRNSF